MEYKRFKAVSYTHLDVYKRQPYILNAVKEYATLGEICGVMREVFGEYEQAVLI